MKAPERTLQAWGWRLLLGPASILDGIVLTLTLGTWSPRFTLRVARSLAGSRLRRLES